jgi:hypothetical protein
VILLALLHCFGLLLKEGFALTLDFMRGWANVQFQLMLIG